MSSLNSHFSEDGNVYTWGSNGNGELGIGDFNDRNIPTLISWKEGKILEIGLGFDHSIFVAGF